MARLAISKDYFLAYARLPIKAQRKADEFLRKFEQDSTAAAIHLDPIKRTIDSQLRSARIGNDYRVILRAPENGDVFLVLWADQHDEAYRWAVTKQTAVHPATGSLQIFDVTEATVALARAPAHEYQAARWEGPTSRPDAASSRGDQPATQPPNLFERHSDNDLFFAGVPSALLPSIRALASDADLELVLPHLPPEAGEILTALAAGIPLNEALEKVLGRVTAPAAAPTPPAIDVADVPAALARDTTKRQFRLLDDGLDLDAALKYPLDVWRVFLHPRQRQIARARTKSPTRPLGGAGTGKTVVALNPAPAQPPIETARPAPDTRPDVSPVPATVGANALATILKKALEDLDLPRRLMDWAHRKHLETLGDLARLTPRAVLSERNLGRKSIQDARTLVEGMTGRRWEELVDEAPSAQAGRSAANAWDASRKALTTDQQEILLDVMPLPTRLKTFIAREKLRTLGDLAEISHATLIDAPNLGRVSVNDLPRIIASHLKSVAKELALANDGLLECFEAVVEPLEPTLRIVANRRSGLGGEPMTLKALGDIFGVTRERVRQLETKLCEQLARQAWTAGARRRVEVALENGPVPLASLSQDPWWAAASTKPSVVAFIIENLLQMDVEVIELGDVSWLSRHNADVVAEALSALIAVAKTVRFTPSPETLEPLVAKAAEGPGPNAATYFREELKARMKGEKGEPGNPRVLAFGDTRTAKVLAILRAAPEPMHVDELFRQMGRGMSALPDEVLHFRRGYVGLRRHFPNFEEWQARLVPAAVRIIRDLGAERQWYCGELLDELREEQSIPEWLTAFGLAALIKASGSLRYLGRLRVALPGNQESDRRVYVHEAIEQILLEAGGPLPKNDLVAKLDKQLGMSDKGLVVLNQPQFVRVDEDHIGLLSRDVPGGAAAIAEAGDHMEGVLERRSHGLSDFHAHQEIVGLSRDHATWSQPLMMSVLRSDGRFRLSQSGSVGLAIWDSTRVPTRLELVRSAIDETGGRVSVEAVFARIEAHYGERPSRSSLINIAMNVGAGVDGEWIVRKGFENEGGA